MGTQDTMRAVKFAILFSCSVPSSASRLSRNVTTRDECTRKMCDDKICIHDDMNGDKKPDLSVFLDFDGTIEQIDKLAHHVMDELPGKGNTESHCTLDKMKKALDDVIKSKTDLNVFRDYYFNSDAKDDNNGRWSQLKKTIGELRDARINVYILSASWRKIGGTVWKQYLEYLTGELNLGFDDVFGLDDEGGSKKADKGGKLEEVCHGTNKLCLHLDNTCDYVMQAVSQKHGGMCVITGRGVVPRRLAALKDWTNENWKQSVQFCTVATYQKGQVWEDGWKTVQ